jgi:UDP-glucose 4-epimerase
MAKILVAGGAGYIDSHMVKMLLDKGGFVLGSLADKTR